MADSSSSSFTMNVSERTMRRVQITMAAMQAAEQTAQAVAQAGQGMVDQARKSLDEALGAICDAHDQSLPEQYTLTLRPKDGTVTLTDTKVPEPREGDILPEIYGGPSDATLAAQGLTRNALDHPNGTTPLGVPVEAVEGNET